MTGHRPSEADAVALRWVRLDARPDPLDLFASCPDHDRFYWERPESGEALVGFGRTMALSATGPQRFHEIERGRAATAARLGIEGEAAPVEGAFWLGGFSFDDAPAPSATWHGYPAARFVLPRLLWLWRDGECLGAVAGAEAGAEACAGADAARRVLDAAMAHGAQARAAADRARERVRSGATGFDARSDATPEAYRQRVAAAVAAIAEGSEGLEKIVVARSCRVRSRREFDAVGLMRQLRTSHPGCVSFAVGRGRACFLGASPERLLRLDPDGHVRTEALAGTRPRGRTPEEDAALAKALLESKKDQAEHALVVRGIRRVLEPLCTELRVPEAPGIFATAGIQHLQTRLVGVLADPRPTLPELAARLHPTPAVGGMPGPLARRWLCEHEGLDRGWYAAPLGFLGTDGSGELSVALRCALIRGRRASAWAGAGIVADSDPADELAETRLKLRTILTPMMEI